MEDVYTIKVKTKPDVRNLYPSERRYSASTVSGLAWVHIALAATTFLLSCLTLITPDTSNFNGFEDLGNSTDTSGKSDYVLVLAPCLITIFALASGVTALLASIRWYIDRNITWFFITSILTTLVSLSSFVIVAIWTITDDVGTEMKEVYVLKHSDVMVSNETHFIIPRNATDTNVDSNMLTDKVLSINILIAAFLELVWSVLSTKIAFRGMRSNYNVEDTRGNCVQVVTTIKGDMNKRKNNIVNHYPSRKIKRIFLAQSENGFYLKNQNSKAKNTETSSEFYKERMMNFLNRCASLEGVSNPEQTPSVRSEVNQKPVPSTPNTRVTPVSWGDSPEHMVYNQNNLNLDRIFNFRREDKTVDSKD
ncbi:unnamed protein product [Leptosia nina]|uniref:Uncharacterized protein n=1 Tax=Leptosia nina TaxID=320188 RepID=A0AAV1JKY0_9NEOP